MIAYLRGVVREVAGRTVVLDVNGVGYELTCTTRCVEQAVIDQVLEVVVFTEVREDAIKLYGFSQKLEKQVFLLLLRVKGVGPKSASEIVSMVDTLELLKAVADGDVPRLQAVRGIGKKTAERIVVELRDKVGAYALESQGKGPAAATAPLDEALEALVSLGISRREAEQLVRRVREDARVDQADSAAVVRAALQLV